MGEGLGVKGLTPPAFQPPDCAPVLGELSVYRLRGYVRGGVYKKLLSPCFRETRGAASERVSLNAPRSTLPAQRFSLNAQPYTLHVKNHSNAK